MHGSFFTIIHSAWLSNRPATMGMQKAYLSYKNNKRTNSPAIVNISKLKLFGNLYKKYICAPDAHAVSLTTCEISIYIYTDQKYILVKVICLITLFVSILAFCN